ncbi:MAG: helix-turn-helix domain-containing protein [Planctomycetota bacterium]
MTSKPPQVRVLDLPSGTAILGVCTDRRAGLPALKPGPFTDTARLDRPKFLLHHVIQGQARFQVAGQEPQVLGPGHCFQRIPGRSQRSWHSSADYRDCYLFMSTTLLQPFQTLGLLPLRNDVAWLGRVPDIDLAFTHLHRALGDAAPDDELLLRLHRLASLLHRQAQADGGQPRWLRRARILLGDPRGPSVDAVADQLGMPAARFRRAFREHTGMPPGRFRIRRRIECACRLLQDLHPTQVAERLGYPDLPSFCKQFRKHAGLTPSEHRQLTRATAG